MLEQIVRLAQTLGVDEAAAPDVARAIAFGLVVILAAIAFFVAKRIVLRIASAVVRRTKSQWDDRLVDHRVFFWLAHLAPAIVIYLLIPTALSGADQLVVFVRAAASIYMIVVTLLAVDSLLNATLEIYNTFKISTQVPLKAFVQVAKIIVYIVAIIVVLATVLGKSPLYLLSGMGVVASVLMLVFKDPILGFVAGIQLSANRMLSRGDWIEMPKYGADGDVIDITLTTVKVQNWDRTITTVPTYALISDSFKNWRGMSESGGRRIKRSVMVDMNTIRLCDDEMIERFAKIRHLADYVREKQAELATWNTENQIDDSVAVNGRRLTNIGTFRAYILRFLRNHPKIRQDMTLLVRQLAPTANGLPIEIYCFSSDQEWANYEDIQADIFDHILAVAPEFGLLVYQNPSGSDLRSVIGVSHSIRREIGVPLP